MQYLTRRSLLAGTGSALALGAAGCLGQAAPSEQEQTDGLDSERTDDRDGGSSGLPDGLAAALEYVHAPAADDGLYVRIYRPGTEDPASQNRVQSPVAEAGEAEWIVHVGSGTGAGSRRSFVATGTFDVDEESEEFSPAGRHGGFDRYDVDTGERETEKVVATDGETLLSGPASWVESAIDRSESGEGSYVDRRDGVRPLLRQLEYTGQTAVLVDGDDAIRSPFERADVDTATLPDLLAVESGRTDEAISYTMAGWYEETPDSSNVETLESYLSTQLSMDEPTVELHEDEQVVVVAGTRSYTPPEERPDTVGVPRFSGYDADEGVILFRFDRGDQLPVDRYEIEIEDEVYEGDWARGQEEIGEGDVVAVDVDAIEPGDDFSMNYESPNGSYGSATGTSALRRLPFDLDFDPDARTASIAYGDGPPLPADRISVSVGDDERVVSPWDGELAEGDATTVADLPMDAHLTIEYERTDGEQVRIGGGALDAPGRFDFDYDGPAERLTVRYPDFEAKLDDRSASARRHVPDQEPLDASRYEITVDGEPADRQLVDVGEEITPGDAVTIPGVPVDTEVSVVWLSEDGQRYEVAATHTVPEVEFAFDYDADSDELTVRHAGGQAVDPARLGLRFHHPEERTVDWDTDGPFAEGDAFVVADVDEAAYGLVTYRERYIDRVHVREIRSRD